MPYYVDVAATGIQRYLARTPKLKWHRGASAALVEATSGFTDELLPGSAAKNDEKGEIDGVVSLKLADTADRDAAVNAVLTSLRQKLPGAVFQISEGAADNYLHAYLEELKPRIERGEVQQDLPAAVEFPGVQVCGLCRTDPAVSTRELEEGDTRTVCADCLMRDAPETTRQGRTAEQRLRADVGSKLRSPAGFEELVTLGRRRTTHLATVYADGNRVGGLLSELAASDSESAEVVIRELPEITWSALRAATCAVRDGHDDVLCVVPHVVGGDDVLVSLPADRAWRFVRDFLSTFEREFHQLLGSMDEELVLPTMSAGIVFARHNYPFASQVDDAARCLREAKSVGAGQSAWVQFTDATADGSAGPGRPIAHAALTNNVHSLSDLAALPSHHRGQLAEALQRHGASSARALAERLSRRHLLDAFADDAPHPAPGECGDKSQLGLAEAFRITRWWS